MSPNSVLKYHPIPPCCRFCLDTKPDQLIEMFVPFTPHPSISTINTTIKQTLQLLRLLIFQNDGYPNWICEACKNLLYSVECFVTKAKESKLWLDQMLIKGKLDQPKCSNEEGKDCTAIETGDVPEENQPIADWTTNAEGTQAGVEGSYEWLIELNEVDVEQDLENSVKYEPTCDEEENLCLDSSAPLPKTISIEQTEVLPSFQWFEKKKHSISSKRCPICGIRSTSLLVHIRSHTNVRPYKCDQCEKAFLSSNKLKCHINSAHSSERNFSCKVCGKSFALAKVLRAHELSHTDVKKFQCPVCEKRFIFRWALAKHERTHTGEKPFPCSFEGCDKHFVSSSNLRQHEKTHAHPSQRTTICVSCGKAFRSKYALRTHCNTHHKISETSMKNIHIP